MRDCGLTYDQARCAYNCVVSLVEHGVVNGSKIGIGQVGAITPVRRPPREVTMGFERKNGGKIVKTRRLFHLDERTKWVFKLYRGFETRNNLKER